MRYLVSLLSGGFFGAGLVMSGMTDTRKVQGWLDVFGDWDPTLAFVLGGAILPMLAAWRVVAARERAVLGETWPDLPAPRLDRGLLAGSASFGAGWALVGLCPGPAIASLSYGGIEGIVFFGAMAAGMIGVRFSRKRAPGI